MRARAFALKGKENPVNRKFLLNTRNQKKAISSHCGTQSLLCCPGVRYNRLVLHELNDRRGTQVPPPLSAEWWNQEHLGVYERRYWFLS